MSLVHREQDVRGMTPADPASRRPRGAAAGVRHFLARAPLWFLLPAVLLLLAFAVYPLLVLLQMAFSNVGPSNIVGTWHLVGLANFREVLGGDRGGLVGVDRPRIGDGMWDSAW